MIGLGSDKKSMLLRVWNLESEGIPSYRIDKGAVVSKHKNIPKRQHHESKDIEQLQQYLLHYECEENKKHRGWSRLKAVLTMCGRSGS